MNKPVLITDVRYRMSLSIIRSLGRKGIRVIAADRSSTPTAASLGFFSKYTSERLSLSDSDNDEAAFVRDLMAYSKKSETKPVLIPVGIHSLMAVSKHKAALKELYDFIVPDFESIDVANDTGRLLDIAKVHSVPAPATTTLHSGESVEELSKRISYPVVIKYRQGELLKLGPEKRYRIIHDSTAFLEAFTYMHKLQEYPLVQEYISGDGYGVSAIFDESSEPIAVFCHKRLREYPVSGGPSCFCESYWNEAMVQHSIRLLKALKWKGIAMVEYKGSPEGRLALMEINPRIWGSFPLTVAAKADFPLYIYETDLGKSTPLLDEALKAPSYKVGKKLRYILQDLMSFKGYLRLRRDKLAFILSFIRDIFNPAVSDGVMDIRDIRASVQYFKQALKKYNN